jgi:general stress protein YciG
MGQENPAQDRNKEKQIERKGGQGGLLRVGLAQFGQIFFSISFSCFHL